MEFLEKAKNDIEEQYSSALEDLYNVSVSCYCHYKSTLNQIDFVMKRRENLSCKEIYQDEISLAVTEWNIMRNDSRIGYEASNHYYFTFNDLMEKVINCAYLASLEEK